MMMKRLLYWMLCLVLLSGCGKDSVKDEPDEPENPVKPQNVTLELSLKDLVFEVDGGRKTFVISCNSEWTIENNSDWCRTDFSSGTGNLTVTVITESYDGMEDRNTNLTVKAGDKTQVLGVTQKYRDAIVLSKDKFEVPQEGKTISVEVKSNISYKVTIPEEFESWIAPAPSSRTVTTKSYDFTVSATDSTDVRSGFIVFSGNSLSDTVWVYQAQRDRLLLSQSYYSLSSTGGTFSVELKTNVDYDVIIPDSVSWVSRIETRALRTDRLSFSVSRNESRDDRSTYIRIKDRNSSLYSTLYIYQSGKGYLELSHKSFTVPQEGGKLSVSVESNTSYTVTIPLAFRSWITQLPSSRTVTTKEYNFNISANENFSSREGYIIFIANTVKDTVYIVQSQKDYLKLSQTSYEVLPHAGELAVELQTNVDYDVIIPDSIKWVSQIASRSLNTDKIYFSLLENDSRKSREAVISLKKRDGNLAVTLCIRQLGKVLELPDNDYEVIADGGELSVEVRTNVDYEVIIPETIGWVSRIETQVPNRDRISLKISENESQNAREAVITVKALNSDISETFYIRQAGKVFVLSLPQKSYTVSGDGETISVEIQSNISYDVTIPAEFQGWITQTSLSKVLTTHTCNFVISKNENIEVRSGYVVFSGSSLTDTVYIRQQCSNITETVLGVKFEMVYVEGGTFNMGATSEQGSDYFSNERPVHSVTLSDYYIGKFEVTQGLWEKVMGTTIIEQQAKADYDYGLGGIGADYPMYYVNWDEAQEFCTKLGQLTGRKYALPTEAQWEYAARGGVKSKSYKYSGSNTIGNVAWYNDNNNFSTHPVGTKQSNELGIYDMSGNVYEWCSDWYGGSYYSDYYSSFPIVNPTGPETGSYRVLRGGGWGSSAGRCRVSYRSSSDPGSRGSNYFGFRVVLLP